MGHCRDCRWWETSGSRSWGSCELAASVEGHDQHPESLATAHDGENYGAELVTSADFGCVQFAAKVKETK